MATVTESPTATVRLTQDAANALLAEARNELDNAARELHVSEDKAQAPTIAACVEIIGRLSEKTGWRWPTEESEHSGTHPAAVAEFGFTAPTLDWVERDAQLTREHVADLESGETVGDPGYHRDEAFLAQVLESIVRQRSEGAV